MSNRIPRSVRANAKSTWLSSASQPTDVSQPTGVDGVDDSTPLSLGAQTQDESSSFFTTRVAKPQADALPQNFGSEDDEDDEEFRVELTKKKARKAKRQEHNPKKVERSAVARTPVSLQNPVIVLDDDDPEESDDASVDMSQDPLLQAALSSTKESQDASQMFEQSVHAPDLEAEPTEAVAEPKKSCIRMRQNGGQIVRVTLFSEDTLRGALGRFCELEGLDAKSVCVLLRGTRVQPDTQVGYLETGVDDIFEVASKSSWMLGDTPELTRETVNSNQSGVNATAAMDESTEGQILLKLRSADGKTHKYRMRKTDSLLRALERFCAAEKRTVSAARLIFDGDCVDPTLTAADLDLEDDDLLDVSFT